MKKTVLAAIAMAALCCLPSAPVLAQPEPESIGGESRSLADDRDQGTRAYPDRWRYPQFNGYTGFRERRPGYRYYNGFWYPQSAFSVQIYVDEDWPRRRSRGADLEDLHIEWCEDHYRSYRISDNTFKPRNGRRRECISPYS